jgi:putative flippase GtrA
MSESNAATAVLVIATPIAVAQAFLGYKYFVFGGGPEWRREFMRFCVVYAGTFLFNLVALRLLIRFTPLGPGFAQGGIVAFCAGVSYLLHQYFSFRPLAPRPTPQGGSDPT